ncbi:Puromycin-sensitive aminopeptidase [Thalictrum thalictroides]|uniref:Puromycin-sensitive aminopeptidase n=1 Tax=Thalictrum thalictroides TaxID=46969 RepID=A0A7J6XHI8_THATH|nr:Puromycin-sensitive aminopeptidase [Thalictrum thalictroides]
MIWTPAQDLPKTVHAMYSLKAVIKWDEDGAEVVRMYKTLLGSQRFRKAVTCEEFFAAMRDANDANFHNFLLWYS